MIQPLAIAELLKIQTFVIFDGDTNDCDKKEKRDQHEKDNLTLLRLCGVDKPEPLPTETFQNDRVCMWVTDMGDAIRKDIGEERWSALDGEIRKKQGINAGKFSKNALFIGSILAEGWRQGFRSGVLEKLCKSILGYAAKSPN